MTIQNLDYEIEEGHALVTVHIDAMHAESGNRFRTTLRMTHGKRRELSELEFARLVRERAEAHGVNLAWAANGTPPAA